MNDVTIEFFRGNKQEIENEKRRKSALMSCFPKTLGTFDKTRYILVDDDRPNWENHYDKMNLAFLSQLSFITNQQSTPVGSKVKVRNLKNNKTIQLQVYPILKITYKPSILIIGKKALQRKRENRKQRELNHCLVLKA